MTGPVGQSSADSPDESNLLSATALMASGTLVSRLLGMVRLLAVIYLFTATSHQAEIFNQSSTIPSTAYLLIAGGVLNAILVPLLIRSMNLDPDGGQAFSDRIVTLFLIMISGVTVLLIAAVPLVMLIMTPSHWRSPDLAAQYHSMTILTALCLPQVFFFGVFFLAGQILNARGSFGPLMWAPVFNNVIQIAVLGVYATVWRNIDTSQPFTTQQTLVLGLGSTVAVVCQTAILVPYLAKYGFRYHPRFDFLHQGLGRVAVMAKWALGIALVDQINVVIINKLSLIATAGEPGAGNTVLQTAVLISLVPHSLLTVSAATAILPTLSAAAATKQWPKFTDRLHSSLRAILATIVPIAWLLVVTGVPIGRVIGVTRGGTYIGWTVVALSIGLVPLTLRFLVIKAFNSMENTRTPFVMEVIFVAVTCSTSILFILLLKTPVGWIAPALGLAYSLGYVGAIAAGWVWLCRAVPGVKTRELAAHLLRTTIAATPGTALAWCVCHVQNSHYPGFIPSLLCLIIAGIVALASYYGCARLIKITEVRNMADQLGSILLRNRRLPGR